VPRSRNRMKTPARAATGRKRWDWRRVAGGVGEFFRNIAVIAFSAPFIEPVLTGDAINADLAIAGIFVGFAFLATAIILDHERRD
jgi:hypothetical protein